MWILDERMLGLQIPLCVSMLTGNPPSIVTYTHFTSGVVTRWVELLRMYLLFLYLHWYNGKIHILEYIRRTDTRRTFGL